MSMSHTDIHKQTITLTCQDGYPLTATLYRAAKSKTNRNADSKSAVLFAPATGIKRGFYNSLATHLATLGYGCLTFDNRGIGDSLLGSVKDCSASLIDWGTKDLPTAFTALQVQFPNHQYHIIGHSAGGQLIGLIPDWRKIASVFNVACSSGQIDQMKQPFRLQARFFMDVFVPVSNRLFGYTKSEWIGMGEPLPAQVATDWKNWCNTQGYVETDFGKRIKEHWFYDINCPSLWLNASDDEIANNANVDDMTRVFTQMPVERIELSPKNEEMKEIGHMKFFSQKSEKLWKHATAWLEKHSQTNPQT